MKKGRYYKNGEQVALITVSQAVYDNETGRTVKQDLDAIGPECVYDVSARNSGTSYASLSAALAAIPSADQHAGMSIRYIDSTSSKYVQYRLMANAWSTTIANWQGIDDAPTNSSENLVKSGGVDSINGFRASELSLTTESGGWYGYDFSTKTVVTTSGSAIRVSAVVSAGFYVLVANNQSSRRAFILDSNGNLVNYFSSQALRYGRAVYVPSDNCTIYLSSTTTIPIRIFKIDALSAHKESLFTDGVPLYGINPISLTWTYGSYCVKDSSTNEIILGENGDYMYCQLLNLEKGLYFFRGKPTSASIYSTDSNGKVVQTIAANELNNYAIAVPENGGIHLSTRANYITNSGIMPYLYKMEAFPSDCADLFLASSTIVDEHTTKVTTLNTWTSGGYFAGFTNVVKSGTGYYIRNYDIEGYDEVEIVYGTLSDTSARFINIFDKDGHCLVGGVDRSNSSLLFKLDGRAKYLCASTLYNTSVVYLRKYAIKTKVNNNREQLRLEANPLANINSSPTFIRCFKKITCIGDSLTAGAFNINGGSSTVTIGDYSYPAMLQKFTGVETVNLGRSGSAASRSDAARSWYDLMYNNGDFVAANIGDCVIIALGTNDITQSGFDGDASTDIDTTDRTNNASTSVGGYANIIQAVLELNPKAKIFCASVTNDRNDDDARAAANVKIKAIAELFGCYYIDLATYAETTASELYWYQKVGKNNSHGNALGYNIRARQYATYIDWIISTDILNFREIQFIGSNYQYYT